jgi:predicted outer membrane repeat protein
MTIEGPGAGLLAISGRSRCRVFEVGYNIVTNLQVTLSGLTIENGMSQGPTISDNEGAGGGIYNTGTLTVSGCTITNNTAYNNSNAQFGGGIFNHGILTLTGCTLSGNRSGFGGGIDNLGTLTVSGCTLSGNSAKGCGAIANGVGNGHGTATLTNCTFSNNSAAGGGGGIGIPTGSTATLTNCTFSNNSAQSTGGAVNVSGSATLTNCTVSLNSASTGGGIWVYTGGILNLTNTIVAGNTASTGPDIDGAVATADHNLVGNATGASGIVNGVNGNIVGGNGRPVINALLGPLQNNGGPTQTMALLAGSPAIGHADNALAPATDQRGVKRRDLAGELTDIGAFEV